MSIVVNEKVIDVLLLGQGDRQRQLQDLPIRGDVWTRIAQAPEEMQDLLITPHQDHTAARVARILAELTQGAPIGKAARRMSYLTGLVAARLSLEDIWSVLIPLTSWWAGIAAHIGERWTDRALEGNIALELDVAIARERIDVGPPAESLELRKREQQLDRMRNAERQVARLGVLLGVLRGAAEWSTPSDAPRVAGSHATEQTQVTPASLGRTVEALGRDLIVLRGREALHDVWANYDYMARDEPKQGFSLRGLVWSASSNRRAEFATSRSVPAIKGDAARQLFSISCHELAWAVLDSGIDTNHEAFRDLAAAGARSRVKATYDFGNIREILNSGNRFDHDARRDLAKRLSRATGMKRAAVDKKLRDLANAIGNEREVDWIKIEPLVRRDNPEVPAHPHGTHVAGILGGCWHGETGVAGVPTVRQMGVCPDIALYDFRVLGPDAEQTEFAVIAALQFIGFLNRRNAFPVIDGINMSLSIPHDVRNYACGYTPVCLEAEARVAQGTVVVVAAGNRGYQQFRLADGAEFASYAASSITDPGNAEGVITVGSTHRFWPHTYGVSFFSSRGPTGDGRLKPDIVAPGERIESTIPDSGIDSMDGTSMAAPHVSGAAALLIARHRELRGHPAKIKRILCQTATDLGRDRSFQGAGMVDVLRAIQSV